jgi:hypothetical protein
LRIRAIPAPWQHHARLIEPRRPAFSGLIAWRTADGISRPIADRVALSGTRGIILIAHPR